MSGTLFVVATPIGNLEDITMRALRVLREVSLIAAEDTRRTAHLLARYAISTPTTSLHAYNEAQKSPSLLARLAHGESIALVSDAGTPAISDPGQRLIRAAFDAGLRVDPIPGPSAVTAALAASGVPADEFTFLGFPPVRSKARVRWMADLAAAGRTVVFFEAPHRIKHTLQDLRKAAGDSFVVVGRELTKAHGELVKGPISLIIDRLELRGEFTVVVDIGLTPDLMAAGSSATGDLGLVFGRPTKFEGRGRHRQTIAELAEKLGVPPNQVYRAIEEVKRHRRSPPKDNRGSSVE